MGAKISFIAWITHSVFALYYLFMAYRLVAILYSNPDLPKPNPILQNWPFLVFTVFAILNFLYWRYLKKNYSVGRTSSFNIFLSVLFLIAPFIIYFLIGGYFTYRAYQSIQENLP